MPAAMKALLSALFWGAVYVFVSVLGELCGVVDPAIMLLKVISVSCIVTGMVQAFNGGVESEPEEGQLSVDAYADQFIRSARRQIAAERVLQDQQ